MLIPKSHSELEEIAEGFLAKHGLFDGKSVLIELVVQKYGYYVWPVKGLRQFAEAFVPNKPGIIFVDEDQMLDYPQRFRFTLAEELAHILIHIPRLQGKSARDLSKFTEMMTATQYRRYEHDAKYLASCLLMRKSTFVFRFKAHCEVQQARATNQSGVLRYAIRQLALDFCVPVWPASQRAFQLKLINEAEFIELGYSEPPRQ